MKRIAIIGGGAAGLVAALSAAKAGTRVELFERSLEVGRKILASGNGRCNITNTSLEVSDYFGDDPDFVRPALEAFGFEAFKRFCFEQGLLIESREDGRTYPLSNEAKPVMLALRDGAERHGATLRREAGVSACGKDHAGFWVQTDSTRYEGFDALLLCTGSEAAPQLGGCADGYRFAEAFGHRVTPTYPSLVGLHLNGPHHARMTGMKHTAAVSLRLNGVAEEQTHGDILFTRYGISGFAVLDLSRAASEALTQHAAVDLSINMLPGFTRRARSELLETLCKTPARSVSEVLSGVLPLKSIPCLLADAQIDPAAPADSLGAKTIKRLAHLLGDWRFEVCGTHGYRHAEVSGGGVDTAQVDAKSMESHVVRGLYFAGEMLDVVGRRGGYNLHFAWASGRLAALNMIR